MSTSDASTRTQDAARDIPDLSLTMPLYNEAGGVRSVVQSLVATLDEAGLSFQLVLVDNGSHDATGAAIADLSSRDRRVEALHLPRNAGYGGGILAGLRLARAPVLGYLWGDDQVGHYAVPDLYRRLVDEGLDLCKVSRVVRLEGRHRQALTRAYHAVFPLFFPLPSSDIHGCPKLFTRAAFERIQPSSRDWFLDAEIMIRATEAGLAIGELEVVAYPRATGSSKVRWGTVAEFALNLCRFKVRRILG